MPELAEQAEDRRHPGRRPRWPRRRRARAGTRHAARRARSRTADWPRRAPVEPRAPVLAVGVRHRQGLGAPADGGRLELAGARPVPDRRRTSGAVPRAAGHAHAAQGPHPHQQHGDQRRPRRLRQDEEQRPRLRALHHPLPERQGARAAQGRCGDRRHRHLVLAQPGRRRRPAGDRRARDAGAHRLRHARRAGPRARPLRRPHRRRAGRRPFGDRHADRPRAPQGRGAGDRRHLAAARRQAAKRRSAAAPTTSSRRAARWARLSPGW